MKLNLLLTSDVHGYIVPTNYVKSSYHMPFGLERAATCLKRLQRKSRYSLTFDDGDYLEGSPLSHYIAKTQHETAPRQIDAAFNLIHYDYGIVGNHEFNYGQSYLHNSIRESYRQFLCANVVDSRGRHPFGKPYIIRRIGPLKVAVIGFTTQGTTKWEKSKNLRGLRFLSVVQVAKKYVPKLRRRADLVIAAYHGGFECNRRGQATEDLKRGENESYRLLKSVKGIDALLTGHQHRVIAGHLFGVPIVQTGYRGEYVGCVTLNINQQKRVISSRVKLIPTRGYRPDPAMVKLIKPLQKHIDTRLNEPLAHINGSLSFMNAAKARLKKCSFVEFIQKIQMATMGTDLSAVSIFNNEAHGFENPITRRDIMTNYVFPNHLAMSIITGRQLRAAMEQSAKYFTYRHGRITVSHAFRYPKPLDYCYDMFEGVQYVINVARPVGQRIEHLTYHGRPLNPNQRLKIALNRYRAVGGGHYTMYNRSQIVKTTRSVMTQIIIHYLKNHPVITATNNHNFTVIYQK